jgi:Histidine phosphatase superfamily (branch 2)
LQGNSAETAWENIYLLNATARLQSMITGYNWTVTDSYAAQTLCPYETVAFGYSPFCSLFTAEEWQGFEYSIDISFAGNNGISLVNF